MEAKPVVKAMTCEWKGIIPVVPTPFHRDGSIDLRSYRSNIDQLIRAGVHGIIALGTAGEGPSLTTEESVTVTVTAIESADGRVPVLAGIGGPNEASVLDLVRRLEAHAPDGFLVVTPYLYPLTRTELLAYFGRLASHTPLPLMIYNSTYTGTPLDPEMLEQLAGEIHNFIALKEGNQTQASDVIRRLRGRVSVFSSRDLHIHELLTSGGAGAIAFTANIVPELLVALYETALDGQPDAARALQDRLNPLVWAVVSRSFPAGIKAAMELAGYKGGFVRPPLTDFSPAERDSLSIVLASVDRQPSRALSS
jgi:4-hydroxy-tetrahydrodipicolinate synthase